MEDLIYPGVEVDPIGKKRREFIKKKGESEDGTTPSDIFPEYATQRKKNVDHQLTFWED
jgi:hypothetical protein